MCNVRRIPELIGKLMGISRKKLSYQHLLGPIYQTLAKTVSFRVMSSKRCSPKNPQTARSPTSNKKWGLESLKSRMIFFLKRNKSGRILKWLPWSNDS